MSQILHYPGSDSSRQMVEQMLAEPQARERQGPIDKCHHLANCFGRTLRITAICIEDVSRCGFSSNIEICKFDSDFANHWIILHVHVNLPKKKLYESVALSLSCNAVSLVFFIACCDCLKSRPGGCSSSISD